MLVFWNPQQPASELCHLGDFGTFPLPAMDNAVEMIVFDLLGGWPSVRLLV
eukprot:SAG31_NODE_28773_length_405_cov_0.846405_1_plen_50_part_01